MSTQQTTICVLSEWPLAEGFERDLIERTLMREGIRASQVTFAALLDSRPYLGLVSRAPAGTAEAGRARLTQALRTERPNCILSLGAYLTEWLTGRSGIDKWQASVLTSCLGEALGYTPKVIPSYPAERIRQDLSLQLWLSVCCRKLAAEHTHPELRRTPHAHLLNPPLEETLSFLRERVAKADLVSVDIETGRGQINTVGFAISPTEAIAINVLPERLGVAGHYALWREIAKILESEQPKLLQNFIYEQLFFSAYGVRLCGVSHDTMIAQKFLWPEFEMGLDAVGRMYSQMSYWKDDGKSWNNVRDWEAHYEYNCKDTCGTYEGYLGQRKDLEERGLASLHDTYLRRLYPAIAEMCSWGLPVSGPALARLRAEVEQQYGSLLAGLRALPGAASLNPRSPQQLKLFLGGPPRKYAIPKKYDSATKTHKESTDEKSLKKLRLKYPKDEALPLLLGLSRLGKALSSYLSWPYSADGRMRYMINGHGAETGRFSGSVDPWGRGVNPQTIPGGSKGINIKSVFEASPGFVFVQCDLKQAESRFVAYDSADANLIAALEDSARDIHKEVAAEIYGIAPREVTKQQRQLGKKSGHGANYSMKEATFQDACLSEMDLVLSKSEATKVLEAYHKLFPGIRRWHANIRKELAQTRTLRTPLGRVRHFWGRLDDDMFRQAYAYRPQSTIPDIVNHLMLHLLESRKQGFFEFRLLLQCHDSLLLEVPVAAVSPVVRACLSTTDWHPRIELAGGRLLIPTSVEVGRIYGDLSDWGEVSGEFAAAEAAEAGESRSTKEEQQAQRGREHEGVAP